MYVRNRKLAKRDTPNKLTTTPTIDDYFTTISLTSSSSEDEEKEQSITASSCHTTTLRLKRKKPNPSSSTEQKEHLESGTPTIENNNTAIKCENNNSDDIVSVPSDSTIGGRNEKPSSQILQVEKPNSVRSIESLQQQQLDHDSSSSNNETQCLKLEKTQKDEFKIPRIEESNNQLLINDSNASVFNNEQVAHSPLLEEEVEESSTTAFFATYKDETVLILHKIASLNSEPSLLISKIKSKFLDIPNEIVVKYWDDFVGGFVRFDRDVLTYISKSNTKKVKLLVCRKL